MLAMTEENEEPSEWRSSKPRGLETIENPLDTIQEKQESGGIVRGGIERKVEKKEESTGGFISRSTIVRG